ncbi:MAG: class I SAM-dependent methyltransferase [Chloroflexi bacterium]|nr:class I SAM-dependent methyltransferase [Chloroflexota bacterium]
MLIESTLKQISPPILWTVVSGLSGRARTTAYAWTRGRRVRAQAGAGAPGSEQALEIYWDPDFARILDTWGEGNAWAELVYLLANCEGRILDVACGTGRTMEIVAEKLDLPVEGCDISDFLIEKAVARGIPRERLTVCDATRTGFEDNAFDFSYSIGSLEHFTEDGITAFIKEMRRITKRTSFHQLPVSRNGKNHGWITPAQSYFNNSVEWWLSRFESVYDRVVVLDSRWEDNRSVGKWFVCRKA